MMVMDRTRIKMDKETWQVLFSMQTVLDFGKYFNEKVPYPQGLDVTFVYYPTIDIVSITKASIEWNCFTIGYILWAFFVAKLSRSYFRSVCLFVC